MPCKKHVEELLAQQHKDATHGISSSELLRMSSVLGAQGLASALPSFLKCSQTCYAQVEREHEYAKETVKAQTESVREMEHRCQHLVKALATASDRETQLMKELDEVIIRAWLWLGCVHED